VGNGERTEERGGGTKKGGREETGGQGKSAQRVKTVVKGKGEFNSGASYGEPDLGKRGETSFQLGKTAFGVWVHNQGENG